MNKTYYRMQRLKNHAAIQLKRLCTRGDPSTDYVLYLDRFKNIGVMCMALYMKSVQHAHYFFYWQKCICGISIIINSFVYIRRTPHIRVSEIRRMHFGLAVRHGKITAALYSSFHNVVIRDIWFCCRFADFACAPSMFHGV